MAGTMFFEASNSMPETGRNTLLKRNSKDVGWEFGDLVDPTNMDKLKCNSMKMTWQSCIDDHLMADIDGCHLTAAALVGLDGTVWPQSTNFPQFKLEEINAITTDFKTPGTLAPTGLHLGGIKYMVIQGLRDLAIFFLNISLMASAWQSTWCMPCRGD